ncbi:hypothetical protein WMF11_28105 [Sorangium sp. So ce295]|uniref:hypothetical protein n=1 Tax=Sorangium sp. So ce295 TaxID=3133295 RepID=UPI003F60E466
MAGDTAGGRGSPRGAIRGSTIGGATDPGAALLGVEGQAVEQSARIALVGPV